MTKTKNIIANFKHYWFLMKQLISRDFKVKYKRSVLGVLWSLLYPILMLTVMTIVFSNMFKFQVEGVNYIVYLMTGLIMWNYFSEASNTAMTSVVSNFALINKVYIPKYIFPIAKCLFVGINFLLTLIPWLGIVLLSYFGLGHYTCHINIYYLLLPYIFLCFFIFTVGISLFLSCVSVFLRDVFYIYGIILTIWNYMTPVFYSIEILPAKLQSLFKLNPLYQYLSSARQIVVSGTCPSLKTLTLIGLVSIITLLIGSVVFKKNQDKFIYYV
ncbi:MAG: ABC transporter permease [Bacilli bacterium]|nr:ABC transporter permease [Bacilli bacterium]